MIKPHRIIGENYLHRWHLIPRNRWFNVYLHKFLGSDDGRALHDHPWASVSILLKGWLIEVLPRAHGQMQWRKIRRFLPVFRKSTHAHRLVVVDEQDPAWTLFITGPVVRAWGFHCPSGWVHHNEFPDDTSRGCD